MFSDIVGYTAIMGRDEREGLRAVSEHRARLRAMLPRFNGRLIGEVGDGTLSSFHSAVDAVNCARELQASLVEHPDLRLRIGIHVGDVVFTDNTVLGDGVNVASRIHELAPPGGSCISERVYEEIRNKPEFQVKDLGEKKLKNVPRSIHVYALTAADASGQHPSPLGLAAGVGKSIAKRRTLAVGVGALLAVALAAGIATWRRFTPGSAAPLHIAPPGARSIAVLPLENLSGDPAQEYFADGMTDELITDLAKISGLRVISRTSVMKFKGEHREQLPEIAKALNVDTIVEGSVLRVGEKVRITAQLIDAASDKHLWADSYERDTRDVLTLQDELASTIAREIDVQLTPNERARFAKPRPVNPEALEAVLKGTYFMGKFTGEGFQKATEYFEQAIKIAPDFAPGYVGLAYVNYFVSDMNQDAIPKAKGLLATALRLDGSNADAHSLLGTIRWNYDYDRVAAEAENRRAIELASGNANTHVGYALMLLFQAPSDEKAERELKLAQQLDPLTPVNYVVMSWSLGSRGDFPKALEQCHKALEIDPSYWYAYSTCLCLTYDRMGNHGEALKACEKGVAIELAPTSIAFLGWEYARSGDREQARKVIEQLRRLPAQTHVAPCWPAMVYAGLGENNAALDLLEKAYQERSGCVAFLKVQDFWDPLRSDPRFIALLKKVGLDK